jgi:hypothetical protein
VAAAPPVDAGALAADGACAAARDAWPEEGAGSGASGEGSGPGRLEALALDASRRMTTAAKPVNPAVHPKLRAPGGQILPCTDAEGVTGDFSPNCGIP